jgi:3-oxoacyl-[acyl-carrier protein] reductase
MFLNLNEYVLNKSIGASIAIALAKFPLKGLALHYSRSVQPAEELRDLVAKDWPSIKVTLHQADVSKVDECERLAKEVLSAHGQVDIFISNAGAAKRITDILY